MRCPPSKSHPHCARVSLLMAARMAFPMVFWPEPLEGGTEVQLQFAPEQPCASLEDSLIQEELGIEVGGILVMPTSPGAASAYRRNCGSMTPRYQVRNRLTALFSQSQSAIPFASNPLKPSMTQASLRAPDDRGLPSAHSPTWPMVFTVPTMATVRPVQFLPPTCTVYHNILGLAGE